MLSAYKPKFEVPSGEPDPWSQIGVSRKIRRACEPIIRVQAEEQVKDWCEPIPGTYTRYEALSVIEELLKDPEKKRELREYSGLDEILIEDGMLILKSKTEKSPYDLAIDFHSALMIVSPEISENLPALFYERVVPGCLDEFLKVDEEMYKDVLRGLLSPEWEILPPRRSFRKDEEGYLSFKQALKKYGGWAFKPKRKGLALALAGLMAGAGVAGGVWGMIESWKEDISKNKLSAYGFEIIKINEWGKSEEKRHEIQIFKNFTGEIFKFNSAFEVNSEGIALLWKDGVVGYVDLHKFDEINLVGKNFSQVFLDNHGIWGIKNNSLYYFEFSSEKKFQFQLPWDQKFLFIPNERGDVLLLLNNATKHTFCGDYYEGVPAYIYNRNSGSFDKESFYKFLLDPERYSDVFFNFSGCKPTFADDFLIYTSNWIYHEMVIYNIATKEEILSYLSIDKIFVLVPPLLGITDLEENSLIVVNLKTLEETTIIERWPLGFNYELINLINEEPVIVVDPRGIIAPLEREVYVGDKLMFKTEYYLGYLPGEVNVGDPNGLTFWRGELYRKYFYFQSLEKPPRKLIFPYIGIGGMVMAAVGVYLGFRTFKSFTPKQVKKGRPRNVRKPKGFGKKQKGVFRR